MKDVALTFKKIKTACLESRITFLLKFLYSFPAIWMKPNTAVF